jgi:endonuclease/exonuclease/phosphatase family metal-dependent hydrolase
VRTPAGAEVLVLVNHFKSKRGGGDARLPDHPHLVVLGDLNDTPDSDNLAPLINDTQVPTHRHQDHIRWEPKASERGPRRTYSTSATTHQLTLPSPSSVNATEPIEHLVVMRSAKQRALPSAVHAAVPNQGCPRHDVHH